MRPVEVTTRYVTSVTELADAWAFVMSRIDDVGGDPSVHIEPKWLMPIAEMADGLDGREPAPPERIFEVVVEGMVEEASA